VQARIKANGNIIDASLGRLHSVSGLGINGVMRLRGVSRRRRLKCKRGGWIRALWQLMYQVSNVNNSSLEKHQLWRCSSCKTYTIVESNFYKSPRQFAGNQSSIPGKFGFFSVATASVIKLLTNQEQTLCGVTYSSSYSSAHPVAYFKRFASFCKVLWNFGLFFFCKISLTC